MSDEGTQEFGEEIHKVGEGKGEEFGPENVVREREEFGEEGESFLVENDAETVSMSSSDKRIKEMSIDRLSALPDSLLLRILSFLELKEAAITGVLSKRWQFLWMDLPTLKFCESSSENEKIRKFVAWVNRTLVICNGRDVDKFEVDFTYESCFASDVNVWVEFAVKNMVRELSLLLNSSSGNDFYTLPQMMFCNRFLRRLSLQRCTMTPQRTIEWRCLNSLSIKEVELPQHVIEKILSGCPVLGSLVLIACWGFNYLEISQKLCALGIVDCEDGKAEALLEISAPNLHTFIIRHYPKGRQLRLTNIASLVKVYIDFNGSDWDASSAEVMSNMKDLLENLQHVQELELGCHCIEVLSLLAVNGMHLPQSRRGVLKVNASSDEHNISGIVGLLESSPNLETLVIVGYEPSGASITLGPAARRDLDCDLLHLKTVYIAILDLAGEPMLTIAQILLKRATVLEKMVIDAEEFLRSFPTATTSSNLNRMVQGVKTGQTILSLLRSPRSSQKAVVLLG